MGPSFAESATPVRRFAWVIGTLCATSIALVALRPAEPVRRTPTASFDRFDHYKAVKKCVGGRWVITAEPQ